MRPDYYNVGSPSLVYVHMTTAIDHFQSQANFITVVNANRLHLTVCGLFPTSCQVIRDHVITTQIPYCEQEMSSYKDDQENRLAIPFYHVYVNNHHIVKNFGSKKVWQIRTIGSLAEKTLVS